MRFSNDESSIAGHFNCKENDSFRQPFHCKGKIYIWEAKHKRLITEAFKFKEFDSLLRPC